MNSYGSFVLSELFVIVNYSLVITLQTNNPVHYYILCPESNKSEWLLVRNFYIEKVNVLAGVAYVILNGR